MPTAWIIAALFVCGLVAGYFIGWYIAKRDARIALTTAASGYGCSVKDLVVTTRRMVEIAEATIREKGTDVIYYPEQK